MRLTRQTEIAIAVLVACAQARGRLLRTETIAGNCAASKDHAAQITSQLARIGWLESYRGRGGGLALAAGAETLSLGDVVRTLQPERRGRNGPSRTLDQILQDADGAWLAYLDRFTIADLVGDILPERCPQTGKPGDRPHGSRLPVPDGAAGRGLPRIVARP